MCVCLFSALSRRVGALQISIITIIIRSLPVDIVVVLVVASERYHGAQAQPIGEQDLGCSVYPHLVFTYKRLHH